MESEYYRSLINDDEEYYKILNENRVKYQEAIKEQESDLKQRLQNAVDREIESIEEVTEKRIEAKDLELSKLSAEQTLLQKHYNILNSITEEQHNIQKELDASLVMYEYLDEETRKLLFNQDDYNKLNEKLLELQGEAANLQSWYTSEILGAEAENIDEITSKYEQKYEILMKSYEIAKAELDVAKKRQQLDNVLNEKNVRMLINGKWEWVANTQDVINAQNELADAEYAKEQAENNLVQQEALNSLTTEQDVLETEKNYLASNLEDIRERWDKIMERMEDNTESVSEVLDLIALSGGEGLQKITNRVGEALVDFYGDITEMLGHRETLDVDFDSNIDYSEAMKLFPKGSFLWNYFNNKRNNKIDTMGLHWEKYANGAKHAKRGLAWINENSKYETIITNDGALIPLANFAGGEKVFSKEMTDRLWSLAQAPLNETSLNLPNIKSDSNTTTNANYYGDFIIQNPANFDDFMSKLNIAVKMRSPITTYSRNS